MELRKYTIFAAPLILLIIGAVSPHAYAWGDWGYNNCGWGNCGYYHHSWDSCSWGNCGQNYGCQNCGGLETGISNFQSDYYQNGVEAGIHDAIYDHENNLVYSDQPSCVSCHSQLYLDGFRHGYSTKWNSYQSQESNQGTSINIVGDNNYVSTSQNNNQQNPLQQLAHTLCGLVAHTLCGPAAGPQGIGYGGPSQ